MYRRAFARHRTGAALLLGLSLRAPSASAEPAEPDETRVGTVEGMAAEELPSAAERPLIPDRARVPYLYQFALPGEANSSLFDVGGLIETPFARGRGSLLPALLSLLSPEVKLDYRDYQTRASHEPIARDRFSVFAFGSYDLLGDKRNGILRRLGDACRPRITFIW